VARESLDIFHFEKEASLREKSSPLLRIGMRKKLHSVKSLPPSSALEWERSCTPWKILAPNPFRYFVGTFALTPSGEGVRAFCVDSVRGRFWRSGEGRFPSDLISPLVFLEGIGSPTRGDIQRGVRGSDWVSGWRKSWGSRLRSVECEECPELGVVCARLLRWFCEG